MIGTAKIFNTTPEYALYDISYSNALLYSKAMPMPGDGDSGNGHTIPRYVKHLDANDPANFSQYEEITV